MFKKFCFKGKQISTVVQRIQFDIDSQPSYNNQPIISAEIDPVAHPELDTHLTIKRNFSTIEGHQQMVDNHWYIISSQQQHKHNLQHKIKL